MGGEADDGEVDAYNDADNAKDCGENKCEAQED